MAQTKKKKKKRQRPNGIILLFHQEETGNFKLYLYQTSLVVEDGFPTYKEIEDSNKNWPTLLYAI